MRSNSFTTDKNQRQKVFSAKFLPLQQNYQQDANKLSHRYSFSSLASSNSNYNANRKQSIVSDNVDLRSNPLQGSGPRVTQKLAPGSASTNQSTVHSVRGLSLGERRNSQTGMLTTGGLTSVLNSNESATSNAAQLDLDVGENVVYGDREVPSTGYRNTTQISPGE